MSWSYRHARYDYGPRKGTLGLCLHMSEGGDELVTYLAGNPARGVSANFALLTTGEMWQMLPYGNASGSLNPADRSTNKAYYGHKYLVDVLGDHWTDPNTWCISLEIAGHAAVGPNAKQVAAIVDWAARMKVMYPSLRGAFGHADQTDTKGCPGVTAAMRGVFDKIGGHGLWETDVIPAAITDRTRKIITTAAPTTWYDLDGKTILSTGHPSQSAGDSPYGVGTKRAIFSGTRIVLVTPKTAVEAATVDCTAEVAQARKEAAAAAMSVQAAKDQLAVTAAVELLRTAGLVTP